MASARVEMLMKKLGCTEEEALDLIAYDKAVDKGQKTQYDLTDEQKKVEKAMKNSDVHAKTEQKVTKTKENPFGTPQFAVAAAMSCWAEGMEMESRKMESGYVESIYYFVTFAI